MPTVIDDVYNASINGEIVGSRKLTNMPQQIHVPEKLSGLRPLMIDYAKEEHVSEILDLFNNAAKEKLGISVSDIPSEEGLLSTIRNPHPYHMFVITTDGKFLGVGTAGPSEYARSSAPEVADSVIILKNGYTGGGLVQFILLQILEILFSDLGYLGIMSDAFVCYPSSYLFTNKMGSLPVGRIPYAGRAGTGGWSDTLLLCFLPAGRKTSML